MLLFPLLRRNKRAVMIRERVKYRPITYKEDSALDPDFKERMLVSFNNYETGDYYNGKVNFIESNRGDGDAFIAPDRQRGYNHHLRWITKPSLRIISH